MERVDRAWTRIGAIAPFAIGLLVWLSTQLFAFFVPQNRLVSQTSYGIEVEGRMVTLIQIHNSGSSTQEAVEVELSPQIIPLDVAYRVERSRGSIGLGVISRGILTADELKDGAPILVGQLGSGEIARVHFYAIPESNPDLPPGIHIGSGVIASVHSENVRAVPKMFSEPFPEDGLGMAAFFLAILGWALTLFAFLYMLASAVFVMFFDSYERRMARMWAAMESLQEQHDRKRFGSSQ